MTALPSPITQSLHHSIEILVAGLGQRFHRQWIFRGLNADFRAGQPTAILGANGAGKSTLLAVLAGWLPPTEGNVTYTRHGQSLPPEHLYRHTALAAPYLDLPDELTVAEAVAFQAHLKPLRAGLRSPDEVVARALLDGPAARKLVRDLSSGMRQRLRLALALLSDADLVLLDEPTANLDRTGVAWYQQLVVDTCTPERLVLVASNIPEEVIFCTATLDVSHFLPTVRR